MPALFVVYDVLPGGFGRITSSATILDVEGHRQSLDALGKRYLFVPLDGHTGYLALDDTGDVLDFRTRDDFPRGFEAPEVAILEVATILDVPACTVTFSGPSVAHHIEHGGGDLMMRFGLPGKYRVAFEAFPFRCIELTLTVAQPAVPEATEPGPIDPQPPAPVPAALELESIS